MALQRFGSSLARRGVVRATGAVGWQLAVPGLRGHCQVPCGIFQDEGRISQIKEDAATIRKAVVQINELHPKGTVQDTNQMIRWINTKEDHAGKIMHTIADYFLAQKVKKPELPREEYLEVLALHHEVTTTAMKTKQSGELGPVDALDAAIEALAPVYTKK